MATKQSSPTASPAASTRPEPQASPEEPRDFLAGLDAALLLAVPLLTFLLASFPARNSDFWIHAAVGRLIANGEYTFGVDPFSFTTEGVYWANHAWLFDLLLYFGYTTLGGPALIVLKALLLAGTSLVLMKIRRPGQGFWLPAAMTTLAVLAMSPRFLMLPPIVSYLFLALTLWLLYRPDPKPAPAQNDLFTPRHLWLLPPLFALWVNLDGWFLLGPLCVGLHLLGEVLQDAVGPALPEGEQATPHRRRVLVAVLAAGVAACLLNPHHIYAFTLPMELSTAPGVEVAARDEQLSTFFLSPFTERFFRVSMGASLAGLAFFPLLVVGVVSFAVNRAQPRWGRTLLWLVFFLLAALNWQLVPFFAVVAAPIAVLNFQDFAARRAAPAGAEPPLDRLTLGQLGAFVTFRWWPALGGAAKVAVVLAAALILGGIAWLKSGSENATYTLALLTIPNVPVIALAYLALLAVLILTWLTLFVSYRYEILGLWGLGGRFLTMLALLVMFVAVWPGWLQANGKEVVENGRFTSEFHRVGWSVAPEPSLVRAAEQMREWREKGLLPENARGLNLSHQVAGYWAYFGGGKTFYDLRLPLFDDVECIRDVTDALALKGQAQAEDSPTAAQEKQELYEKRMVRMQECLRAHRITHVVAFGGSNREGVVAMRHMLADSGQWEPLYLDGRTGIFAWKDPKGSQDARPFAATRYNAAGRAFGDVPEAERAPPPKLQMLNSPWGLGVYLVSPQPRSIESDESELHRLAFQSASQAYAIRQAALWRDTYPLRLPGCAAVGVATDGGVGSGLTAITLTALRVRSAEPVFFPEQFRAQPKRPPQDLAFLRQAEFLFLDHFRYQFDSGPPEHALLAVRAARRATAVAPEDYSAWLRLSEAYQSLASGTRERFWSTRAPSLSVVRRAQFVAALKAVVALNEDSPEDHHRLATMFRQMGFSDLYLKHSAAGAAAFKKRGAPSSDLQEKFESTVEEMDREVERIEKAVKEQQDLYLTASQGKRPLEQAQMALARGLVEEAILVLQQASFLDLGIAGYQLQVRLLLDTGRLDEVRAFEWDQAKTGLGLTQTDEGSPQLPAAEWFRLILAAASGEYTVAREQLTALINFESPVLREMVVSQRPGPSLPSFILYGGRVSPLGRPPGVDTLDAVQRQGFTDAVQAMWMAQLQQRADLMALRGILALEEGDTKAAEEDLRASLKVTEYFGARSAAEGYLELIAAARKK